MRNAELALREIVDESDYYHPCLLQQIGRGTILLWVNHINLNISGDMFFIEYSSGGMVVGCHAPSLHR